MQIKTTMRYYLTPVRMVIIKKTTNLTRIALNLQIALGSTIIFIINFSDPRTCYISPSVCAIFDFFHQCLIVFCTQVFYILKQAYSQVLTLFLAMVNRLVSFISLSEFWLLVYGNARDFCVLIFYPAILVNSLINTSNLLVAKS